MRIKEDSIIEILAVGSELLTPYFQDTNSLYLTQRLNDMGLDVDFKTLVGDEWESLLMAFRQALSRSNLVITIGGLGPTKDDRTREALASVLGKKLIFQEDLLQNIERRFARRKMKMPAVNKKQAYIIDGSDALANTNGTAPGLWIENESHIIILLPGPPGELIPMFEDFVWPRLKKFQNKYTVRRVIKTAGLTESTIESKLKKIYPKISDIQLTTLAYPGQIEIHFKTLPSKKLFQARERVDHAQRLISDVLKENIFTTRGQELEEVVGNMLKDRHETIAIAESCTGGLLGNRITNVPGSSNYFLLGIIAYSNDAKTQLLDVQAKYLDKFGAVSSQTARAMAKRVREKSKATYGLSITGIAGPSGGTTEKPVGLVYTALSWEGGVKVKKNLFVGDRNAVKFQSSQKALDMLRRHLLGRK
jgi:nicotinamide-nucleotide amidase